MIISIEIFSLILLAFKVVITKTHRSILLPVVGSIVFVVLYFVSTLFYPGGSQADMHAAGFSWVHNYWCNLLNHDAMNGEPNPARPIAIAAMIFLCVSLSSFWFIIPAYLSLTSTLRNIIRVSGILAAITGILLFTNIDHDLATNLASLFGLIATVGIMVGLYRTERKDLFWFGMLNMLLVCVNNLFYRSPDLIFYLPLIQKLTFITFLGWICSVCVIFNIQHLRRERRSYKTDN